MICGKEKASAAGGLCCVGEAAADNAGQLESLYDAAQGQAGKRVWTVKNPAAAAATPMSMPEVAVVPTKSPSSRKPAMLIGGMATA